MTEEMFKDYRLLLIVMFIFILANWYLFVYIVAKGLKRIAENIEQIKGGK